MTEFNGADVGPLGAGEGCVLPRDGKQVRAIDLSLYFFVYVNVFLWWVL